MDFQVALISLRQTPRLKMLESLDKETSVKRRFEIAETVYKLISATHETYSREEAILICAGLASRYDRKLGHLSPENDKIRLNFNQSLTESFILASSGLSNSDKDMVWSIAGVLPNRLR